MSILGRNIMLGNEKDATKNISPEIRTGEELQKAASEVLQITLQLEHANMMHNPYVITSQFFMFVAGIEILDPIYQQWTLTILKELQNWGENMHYVIKLLESIFLLQEQRENTTGDIIQDGYHELGAYLEERYTEQWPTVSMAGGLISSRK
ncbi:hypothetical protein V8C43DRAFT_306307 [Trichoderma afarasin]